MLEAWISPALDLLRVAALLLTCGVSGIALTSTLPGLCREDSREENCLLGAIVGLGVVGTLLGFLALAGRFDRLHVGLLLVICGLAGLVQLRRRHCNVSAEPREHELLGWWWPLAAALPVALLLSLYPSSAFDDTLYHLPLAHDLANEGHLFVRPELRFPVFPLFHEVLIATLLVLGGGDTGAHLLSAGVMVLLGSVVLLWAKRRAGEYGAWGGAALLLGCPLVVWLGGAAYVDLTMALFAVAALWVLETRRAHHRPSTWALAAGLAGAAAATKYHGLFFVGVVGLAALGASWRARRPGLTLVAGLAVAVVAGPWYLRNLTLTGNPVFPFATTLFGPNNWAMPASALAGPQGLSLAEPAWGGLASLLTRLAGVGLDLLRSPWLLLRDSIDPETVPPLSPFAALVLPLAGFWGLFRRESHILSVVAVVYLGLWLLSVRDARYLLPAVALLAVVAASWLARCRSRRVALGLALLLLAPAWGFGALRVVQRGWPPFVSAAREAYLDRWLPGHTLLRRSAELFGPGATVYGLGTEQLQHYAPGRLLGDWNGPYRFSSIEPLLGDPEKLARELEVMGAEALLLPKGKLAPPSPPLRWLASEGGFELWSVNTPH